MLVYRVGWIGAFIQREMKDSRLEIDVSGRTDEWQELRSLDHEDICSSFCVASTDRCLCTIKAQHSTVLEYYK